MCILECVTLVSSTIDRPADMHVYVRVCACCVCGIRFDGFVGVFVLQCIAITQQSTELSAYGAHQISGVLHEL